MQKHQSLCKGTNFFLINCNFVKKNYYFCSYEEKKIIAVV
jgi:hypothetical protein